MKNSVVMNFVVPRRLLLSSQNSGHLLSLTPAQFLHRISAYLQVLLDYILHFQLYLSP